MAKKPSIPKKQQNPEAQTASELAAPAKAGLFVLKKNHGLLIHGRESKFYEAGTTFDPATDGDLISRLVRSGAHIDEVPAEAEPVEETDPSGDGASQGDGAPMGSDKPEGDQSGVQE